MFSHIHSLAWHVQPLHITIHLHYHQIFLWKICVDCWVSKKPFWQNVSSEARPLLPVCQLESQVQPVCTSLDMIACQCWTYVPRGIALFCKCKVQFLNKTIAHNQFCSCCTYISCCVSLILPLFLLAVPFFCSIIFICLCLRLHIFMFWTLSVPCIFCLHCLLIF